jgi:hypothetical protein
MKMYSSALRRTSLIVALGVAGLAVTSPMAPADRAAGLVGPPHISAYSPGLHEIKVYGSGFVPDGSARVIVRNSQGRVIRVAGVVPACSPASCRQPYAGITPGTFQITLTVSRCGVTDTVIAHDLVSGAWSNKVSVPVKC